MASGWFNNGVHEMISQNVDLVNQTLTAMLLKTTYAFNRDHVYVGDLAAHEITAVGYARVPVTGKALTLDSVRDASYFGSDNPVFGPIAAGQTIGFMVIFLSSGGDGTSPLLMCWQLVPTATDGGEFVFNVSASGLSKFWSAT